MKIRIPSAHRTRKFVKGFILLEKKIWERSVEPLKTTRYDPNNMYTTYRVGDDNEEINVNAIKYVETLDI
jgi:hypothetical protein